MGLFSRLGFSRKGGLWPWEEKETEEEEKGKKEEEEKGKKEKEKKGRKNKGAKKRDYVQILGFDLVEI